MISKLCYELYKVGWKQYHINAEREKLASYTEMLNKINESISKLV
jgi:hypothetical protein